MWTEGRTERWTDTHYEAKALFAIYLNALKKCVLEDMLLFCVNLWSQKKCGPSNSSYTHSSSHSHLNLM